MNWNVFISYAHEDRDEIAYPLATRLRELGLEIWFDEFELKLGHSITQGIDHGISGSKAGVLIISKSFFAKKFTKYELRGIVQRHIMEEIKILPIWVDVNAEEVRSFSPSLADLLAANWETGIDSVISKILDTLEITPPTIPHIEIPLETIRLLASSNTRDKFSSSPNRFPFPLIAIAYEHHSFNRIFYRSIPESVESETFKAITLTQKVSFSIQDNSLNMLEHFIFFDLADIPDNKRAVAHELGHCILHGQNDENEQYYPVDNAQIFSRKFTHRHEAEADWFASILITRGEQETLKVLDW